MVRVSPVDKLAVDKMIDRITPSLYFAYSRWLNVRAREGIETYAKIIERGLPDGFSLIRMTKSPFGFRFKLHNLPDTTFTLRVTSGGITWKSFSFSPVSKT